MEIQTKYGVLDRNFSTSELMPLSSTIDLGVPTPATVRKITLHAVAALESTTDKAPVFCKCKDKSSWCSTRRCACVKADVKCGAACHWGGDNSNIGCRNLDAPHLRRRKFCEFGRGMMKENQVKDSGKERSENVGSKGDR